MTLGVVTMRKVERVNEKGRPIQVDWPFVNNIEIMPDALLSQGWGTVDMSQLANGLDIEYDEIGPRKIANVRRYPAIPQGVRKCLRQAGCSHPGLALDKYVYRSADQSFVKHALSKVIDVSNSQSNETWYPALYKRWLAMNANLCAGTRLVRMQTAGPFTLHLSRASALENAGICLHPLYGFVYLPGTGLKGLARAYAETVWFPQFHDQSLDSRTKAWRQIEAVFGWAPNSDNHKGNWKYKQNCESEDIPPHDEDDTAHVGRVVFHEAWPVKWPKLQLDLVNNHHSDYYQGTGSEPKEAPGDWESPNMVSFLCLGAGEEFTFVVAPRRRGEDAELVDLAQQWLTGGLLHLGAGAKTNAGYGTFRLCEATIATQPALPKSVATHWTGALDNKRFAEFTATLELVTPAFLAGPHQDSSDCDLRPATLRGLLRWWWRTLHAGYLDVQELRDLESLVWGNTKSGGAVRITIEGLSQNVSSPAQPYDSRAIQPRFNDATLCSSRGILGDPARNAKKTTQGLWYASYGMDEKNRRRSYREPRVGWHVRLTARGLGTNDLRPSVSLSADQILQQAQAALWLLCHFGAVGSKSRKGFGSLTSQDFPGWSLTSCQIAAAEFRSHLENTRPFHASRAETSALAQLIGPVQAHFVNASTVWQVLDQVGFAYQAFAKSMQHQLEKCGLGLPRLIREPTSGTFRPTSPVTRDGRHASPVHIHLDRAPTGWLVRAIAFPAAHLPNLTDSTNLLTAFLHGLDIELNHRATLQLGAAPVAKQPPPGPRTDPAKTAGPQTVKVQFLGPHAKLPKVYWVQEPGKNRGLLKYGTPREPLPALQEILEVYPTNANPQSPEYSWTKPQPPPPPKKKGSGPKGYRP